MNKINTGGPAFPVENDANKYYNWIHNGMTLRDYFAAQVLPMMMDFSAEFGAAEAYKWADAMLKAREQNHWVGLTVEEVRKCYESENPVETAEDKLKEKNS